MMQAYPAVPEGMAIQVRVTRHVECSRVFGHPHPREPQRDCTPQCALHVFEITLAINAKEQDRANIGYAEAGQRDGNLVGILDTWRILDLKGKLVQAGAGS